MGGGGLFAPLFFDKPSFKISIKAHTFNSFVIRCQEMRDNLNFIYSYYYLGAGVGGEGRAPDPLPHLQSRFLP